MMRKTEYVLWAVLMSLFFGGCSTADDGFEAIAERNDRKPPVMDEVSEKASESNEEALESSEYALQEEIYVHVCGAVEEPGLVKLEPGSRCYDAVMNAGGFREDADSDYTNLAELVQDGSKLYIPTVQETALWMAQESLAEEKRAEQETREKDARININTATEKELCSLPGIGETRAADIIKYRENHGGFGGIEDIKKVSGIKDNIYQKIKDKIRVE